MGSAWSAPAFRAVRNGDIAEIERQIRAYNGRDNWRDLRDGKDRNSLLHIAALHGKPQVVKLLTKQHSFPTEMINGRNNTALLEVGSIALDRRSAHTCHTSARTLNCVPACRRCHP